MNSRSYYSDSISSFKTKSLQELIGSIVMSSGFSDEPNQKDAWSEEIRILKKILMAYDGRIYFEYSIPRMGKRIDVLLIIGSVIFVIEFKVGENEFPAHAIDQVWDYALDLKNFHETSHDKYIAPILVSTNAFISSSTVQVSTQNDKVFFPVKSNIELLSSIIKTILNFSEGPPIDTSNWESGRYCPTPTIIEAALALYNGNTVSEISRSDASATNLTLTSKAISDIIEYSRANLVKSICFVTGVPGAGKTLVGLNVATTHINKENELYSVFLSGNGPLVAILREALARDKVVQSKNNGQKILKSAAMSEIKAFIQNVHNFRDECLIDTDRPPVEHVALFDEAQRAWNLERTSSFMKIRKKKANFNISEPEFLISCLDRHKDWALVVCLVGGGQEINSGEAGITEWIESLNRSFPDWNIFISPKLTDSEYGAGEILKNLRHRSNVNFNENLHLAVSMRSFRSERVSLLVKQLLDIDISGARDSLELVKSKYPIVITRDLAKAKLWLRSNARGSERYGVIVSSQAQRLKPHAIDVRSPMDPIHWFLDGKEDVRSSYYLEDVATEFSIQGLELDWVCVTWDADFRYTNNGWDYRSFVGDTWNKINKTERKLYLKNAYRVLLTRARQGMVIVVPKGDIYDPTRNPIFYDPVYEYLLMVGFEEI
jgi:hypothetical protein